MLLPRYVCQQPLIYSVTSLNLTEVDKIAMDWTDSVVLLTVVFSTGGFLSQS
jgi:hypothetical protein